MTTIDKYIPQKLTSPRWNVQWLRRALKRQSKQKRNKLCVIKGTDNPIGSF